MTSAPATMGLAGFGLAGMNLGLLLLRLAVGGTMVAHGCNHIWGGERIAGTARWFEGRGLEPGALHAWLASVAELVSGAALVLGLLNPLAAAGVVGVCATALVVAHARNGFFVSDSRQGYEYTLNLALAAMALGATGPGRWSLDYALGNELYGLLGFGVTTIVGLGGALVVLVGFWRPVRS